MTKKNDRAFAGLNRLRWFAGFAVAAFAVTVQAASIERCVGAHGEAMFTQSCPGTAAATPRQRPAGKKAAVVPMSASSVCARTPQQLEQQVRSALTTRNGIRLSGLALWRGVSARTARGEARELLQLLKAGSASVALEQASAYPAHDPYEDQHEEDRYEDPYAVDAPVAARPRNFALVVLPVTQRQGFVRSEQLRFDIVRDHGCYWLNPRPQRIFDEPMHAADEFAPHDIEPVALRGG